MKSINSNYPAQTLEENIIARYSLILVQVQQHKMECQRKVCLSIKSVVINVQGFPASQISVEMSCLCLGYYNKVD